VRVLCAGLLTFPLLAVATPAQARSQPQFALASASVLAGGAEVKGTVTITCSAKSADLMVTLTQQLPSGVTASRSVDIFFRCSGALQEFTAASVPDGPGTEPRMHAGPAAVELDYSNDDNGTQIQRWTTATLAPGTQHSNTLGNSARLIGRGGVLIVLATINCKPGGEYEPVATVSQPISPTTVEVGQSAFDIYSGGPDIPCPHTPLAISVPVPGTAAAFHPGPAFVALSVDVYGRGSYLRHYNFVGVVTAVPASQAKEVEGTP
jgi:hypothetical protein